MKIKNTRKKSNYINYKVNGMPVKTNVPAGETVDIPAIKDLSQVINSKDFNIGFFEVVEDVLKDIVLDKKNKKPKKKTEPIKSDDNSEEAKEDSLDKIQKEVEDYINNDEQEGGEDNK